VSNIVSDDNNELLRNVLRSPVSNPRLCFGYYSVQFLNEYEVVLKTDEMEVRGHVTSSKDGQSDCPNFSLGQNKYRIVAAILSQKLQKNLPYYGWEGYGESDDLTDAELEWYQESVGQQDNKPITSDIISLSPSQLCSELLKTDAESDISQLRELILLAEDTQFSVEESEQLGPWLLGFANDYRGSNNPQDEVAVWSAIRTGASMLTADRADRLLTLLEPGHPVETSLVALKMLGRIFEAQPPSDVDQYPLLAEEVLQIANALLNRYVITESSGAAKAHLAIYALAALASTQLSQVVQIVLEMNTTWFTRRTLRKLRTLHEEWNHRNVKEGPLINLKDAIRSIQGILCN